MSGRLELQRLTDLERQVLGALCALKDEGSAVIAMYAADRLGMDRPNAYRAVSRLQSKGWISGGRKVGFRRPLHIVARPRRIRRPPVDAKPVKTFEHRHPEDRPTMRPCLTCGEDFESEGWGNRRCPRCKRSEGAGL